MGVISHSSLRFDGQLKTLGCFFSQLLAKVTSQLNRTDQEEAVQNYRNALLTQMTPEEISTQAKEAPPTEADADHLMRQTQWRERHG